VATLDGKAVLQMFNRAFERWGLPKKMKFDNGLPIVIPHVRDMPTMLVLWWEGLGIQTHRNDPACPRQNATVEGLQGILERWVCPEQQPDIETFQRELDEQVRIQREVFQLIRKKNLTRKTLYPGLEQNPRKFDPSGFSWEKTKAFLAKQVWKRAVSSAAVSVFDTQIYVGKQFAKQKLFLTYDPIEEVFVVRDREGRLVKQSRNNVITKQMILEYANMSKNDTTL
jgi:hypothetical protein